MTYPQFLDERRKLMAQVVRDAYAKLTEHSYAPVYPAAGSGPINRGQSRTPYGITAADLIAADLLPPGTLLTPAQSNLETISTVLPDGKIAYTDEIYDTPSGASDTAAGGSTNGWTYWIADTPDGRFTPRSPARPAHVTKTISGEPSSNDHAMLPATFPLRDNICGAMSPKPAQRTGQTTVTPRLGHSVDQLPAFRSNRFGAGQPDSNLAALAPKA